MNVHNLTEGSLTKLLVTTIFTLALNSGAVAQEAVSPLVSREAPEWVKPHTVDPQEIPERAKESGNEFFLLIERQYDAASKTTYYRYLKRLNNSGGLQDGSQLEASYDPNYQKLQFHSLIIHRDGKAIDRIDEQEFKVIQREKDHERQLYDSSLTALAVIEGTRVHDVLEYSFSVQGGNPAFDSDGLHWILTTGYTVPVGEIFARLRVPEGIEPKLKSHVIQYEPAISKEKETVSFEWIIKNPPTVISEGGLPGDYDPWGWIEASTYKSWGDVADWALAHYEIPESLPEELTQELDRIKGLGGEESKILSALRFVQDEIRYLGIFEGVHSHKPHSIDTILKRRFGDCKDKSLMLTAMLRELGFDATPALVETDYRAAIETWLPAPNAFDHLVVALNFKGRTYWLDATYSYQRGPLDKLYFPDYGKALLIKAGETSLTTVGEQGFEFAKMKVNEHFTLEDYSGPATLKVVTVYTGREADSTRSYFASTPRGKAERNYLNYYSKLYETVQSDGKIVVTDDEESNTLTVEESYLIEDIWTPQEGNEDILDAIFSSQYTYDEILIPSTKNRKMPYRITYPSDTFHEIKISLPTEMEEEDRAEKIRDPAFNYDYSERFKGKTTLIRFHYESLGDRVLAKNISTYLENTKKAENLTDYSMWITRSLYEGNEDAGDYTEEFHFNWTILAVVLVALIASTLACLLLWRWNTTTGINHQAFDPNLQGLGGWLVLPAIGLIIRPFVTLFLVGSFHFNYDLNTWISMTAPSGEFYDPCWAPMILMECILETALLPFSIFVLIRFFQRHETLPHLIIWLLTIEILVSIILLGLVTMCTEDKEVLADYSKVLRQSAIGAAVWIPYFIKSVRVASTFRSKPAQTGPPELPENKEATAVPAT